MSPDCAVSFRELAQESIALAWDLLNLGIKRGDRVIVFTFPEPRFISFIYACSRIGAVLVPISPATPKAGFERIYRDCDPALVVINSSVDHNIVDFLPSEFRLDVTSFAEEAAQTYSPLPAKPISVDPLFFIYTSGSASAPKAVISTHEQVLFCIREIQSRLQYAESDTILNVLPLSFDYGLYQCFLSVASGASIWLEPAHQVGLRLVRRLRDSGATILPCVPSIAEALKLSIARKGEPPKYLRLITTTGAVFPPKLLKDLSDLIPGVSIVRMYGLTECKRVAIMPLNKINEKPRSVGLPLENIECDIKDETGRSLPPGEVGELVVRGPNVMPGYWNSPYLNELRFSRGRFGEKLLHTGDLFHIDDEGYLYFHGRTDDQYKENDVRMSTVELEAAALEIPGVSQAAALKPTHDLSSCLFVSGPSAISPKFIYRQLLQLLPPQKVPKEIVVLESLPLKENGKIDKSGLFSLHPKLQDGVED